MNGNPGKLKEILRRFRFEEPVPDGARAALVASKRRNLVMVLKAAGAYGAFDGLVLSLYFAFERAGYRISYRTGRRLLALTATLAAILLAFTILFAVNRTIPHGIPAPPPDRTVDGEKTKGDDRVPSPGNRRPAVTPLMSPVRLGVKAFTADGLDAAAARGVAGAMYDEIAATCGGNCVAWYDDAARRGGAVYILTGSVRMMEEEYWISVKLLNVETGAVAYAGGKRTGDAEGLDVEAKSLARAVAERIGRPR